MPDINDKLDDIKERLIVIETKMEAFRDIPNKLQLATDVAQDAAQAAVAAHKRLDKYDDSLRWMWRTVIAAVIVEVLRTYQQLMGS